MAARFDGGGCLHSRFVDPARDAVFSIDVPGTTVMAVATLCDSGYAVITGRRRALICARERGGADRRGGVVCPAAGALTRHNGEPP